MSCSSLTRPNSLAGSREATWCIGNNVDLGARRGFEFRIGGL